MSLLKYEKDKLDEVSSKFGESIGSIERDPSAIAYLSLYKGFTWKEILKMNDEKKIETILKLEESFFKAWRQKMLLNVLNDAGLTFDDFMPSKLMGLYEKLSRKEQEEIHRIVGNLRDVSFGFAYGSSRDVYINSIKTSRESLSEIRRSVNNFPSANEFTGYTLMVYMCFEDRSVMDYGRKI